MREWLWLIPPQRSVGHGVCGTTRLTSIRPWKTHMCAAVLPYPSLHTACDCDSTTVPPYPHPLTPWRCQRGTRAPAGAPWPPDWCTLRTPARWPRSTRSPPGRKRSRSPDRQLRCHPAGVRALGVDGCVQGMGKTGRRGRTCDSSHRASSSSPLATAMCSTFSPLRHESTIVTGVDTTWCGQRASTYLYGAPS